MTIMDDHTFNSIKERPHEKTAWGARNLPTHAPSILDQKKKEKEIKTSFLNISVCKIGEFN